MLVSRRSDGTPRPAANSAFGRIGGETRRAQERRRSQFEERRGFPGLGGDPRPLDRISKGGKTAKLIESGSDRRELQELSFHSLRHTASTWLEEAGQPKAVINALIGHEGDTGTIYTTVGEDALRSAVASLAEAGK